MKVDITKEEFHILIAMYSIAPLENMGRPKAHSVKLLAVLDRMASAFGYADALEADRRSPSVPDKEYP